jgi:enoyl-CoA hydratase/carnithine racemase
MSELVRYEIRDRVAVVTVDNPPVNALGAGGPDAISEAVE